MGLLNGRSEFKNFDRKNDARAFSPHVPKVAKAARRRGPTEGRQSDVTRFKNIPLAASLLLFGVARSRDKGLAAAAAAAFSKTKESLSKASGIPEPIKSKLRCCPEPFKLGS